jgi:hypothetical protein
MWTQWTFWTLCPSRRFVSSGPNPRRRQRGLGVGRSSWRAADPPSATVASPAASRNPHSPSAVLPNLLARHSSILAPFFLKYRKLGCPRQYFARLIAPPGPSGHGCGCACQCSGRKNESSHRTPTALLESFSTFGSRHATKSVFPIRASRSMPSILSISSMESNLPEILGDHSSTQKPDQQLLQHDLRFGAGRDEREIGLEARL